VSMATKTEQNALKLLKLLAGLQKFEGDPERGHYELDGHELSRMTGLPPNDLNDAVEYLDERGALERLDTLGTDPYSFRQVGLTSRGRFLDEQLQAQNTAPKSQTTKAQTDQPTATIPLPRNPVGSPFRFEDKDWELVSLRRDDRNKIFVTMGHQFDSTHYNTAKLIGNIQNQFQEAVSKYNETAVAGPRALEFIALSAGYGEHLFNRIARDIISSDIAVFDTSDRNPNVMIEMGVALTWGVRVLPIHAKGSAGVPPSDISGQTWAQYEDSAVKFVNPPHDEHKRRLVAMVERAAKKHRGTK
jgi:hypothetical protein